MFSLKSVLEHLFRHLHSSFKKPVWTECNLVNADLNWQGVYKSFKMLPLHLPVLECHVGDFHLYLLPVTVFAGQVIQPLSHHFVDLSIALGLLKLGDVLFPDVQKPFHFWICPIACSSVLLIWHYITEAVLSGHFVKHLSLSSDFYAQRESWKVLFHCSELLESYLSPFLSVLSSGSWLCVREATRSALPPSNSVKRHQNGAWGAGAISFKSF